MAPKAQYTQQGAADVGIILPRVTDTLMGHDDPVYRLLTTPEEFYHVVIDFGDFRQLIKNDPQKPLSSGWRIRINEAFLHKVVAKEVDTAVVPVAIGDESMDPRLPKGLYTEDLGLDNAYKVMIDWKGKMFAVMGDCCTGKTHIVKCITKTTDLPSGQTIATPGLSARHMKEVGMEGQEGTDLVFIDMQGKNGSIPCFDKEAMDVASCEEQFLRAVVTKVCPNYIYVCNKMNRKQQADLMDLCERCGRERKKIFVVHNWKDIETEKDFASEFEEFCAIFSVVDDTKASDYQVLRHPGTKIVYRTEGICEEGEILKTPGIWIQVDWKNPATTLQSIFQTVEFQSLVKSGVVQQVGSARSTFAVENRSVPGGSGGMVKIVCGQMEEFPVEQIHFFLAKDGSVPGCAKNELTLNLLSQELVANGTRSFQKGKHCGMFNYLEQVVEAVRAMAPMVFKPPELEEYNPRMSETFALKMLQVHGEITSQHKKPGHLRMWAQMVSDFETDAPARQLLFVPRGLQESYQDAAEHVDLFPDNRASAGNFPPFQTYRRVAAVGEKNELEQRRWILQVPGYQKVCQKAYPENEDIQLIPGANGQMSTMEITLTNKKPPNVEPDWGLLDSPGSWPADATAGDETETYAFPVDFAFQGFDFHQEEGLLVITVQGMPRPKQQFRKTTAVSVGTGRNGVKKV